MMAIFVATVMILSALVIALPGMQGREYGMNPAATSSANIQPNPTLNTNVTWSVFHNGWNPLEYSNGTANLTLNTAYSSLYANPINVNPLDIKGSIQNYTKRIANSTTNLEWNEINPLGEWAGGSRGGVGGGAVFTLSNTSGLVQFTLNTSAASANEQGAGICIDTASLPSTNLQYDYLTASAEITSGTLITGLNLSIGLNSAHTNRTEAHIIYTDATQSPLYMSVPLSQYAADIGYNTSGTYYPRLDVLLNVPQSTTATTYTVEIGDFAITTYPNSLGTATSNGSISTITNIVGNAHLTSFSPAFSWTEVDNSGYSVATSQSLQNLTTQQSAINSLGYVEQVEYQGQFMLPTAPDLTYGPANITEHFNVSTSQTQVLDINGVSYLSTISGKNNTVRLLSSTEPNSQTQFLQIVDYTQSQWTSISSPPGIFTLAGIEYYWEEFIIAILAIVGVGAGAASRHASNLRKVK